MQRLWNCRISAAGLRFWVTLQAGLNDGYDSWVQEGAVVIDFGINVDENAAICAAMWILMQSVLLQRCDSRTGGLAT